MTSEQIKVINELLNDKGVKGKKQLKNFLWLNTSTPEFKIGECFIVSDPGHRVYGYQVKNFKAKVTEVKAFGGGMFECEWRYTLEMEVECGSAKTVSKVFKSESELSGCQRCEDNSNTLGATKSKYSESIEM